MATHCNAKSTKHPQLKIFGLFKRELERASEGASERVSELLIRARTDPSVAHHASRFQLRLFVEGDETG